MDTIKKYTKNVGVGIAFVIALLVLMALTIFGNWVQMGGLFGVYGTPTSSTSSSNTSSSQAPSTQQPSGQPVVVNTNMQTSSNERRTTTATTQTSSSSTNQYNGAQAA